jgi:hypothetical protein
MAEEQQAVPEVKTESVDTIQVVTSDGLREFTNSKNPQVEQEAQTEDADDEREETPTETAEASATQQEEGERLPKKQLSKKQIELNERFSKITAEKNAAIQKAAERERELAELRSKYEPPAAVPDVEPDPAKYTDAKEYAEDYASWKIGANKAKERQEAEQRTRAGLLERFNKERDTLKSSVDDWDARVAEKSHIQMHSEVIDHIMESDYPAQIFYEMTAEDAERINNLPTMRARLREVTRMEEKLRKSGAEQSAPAKTAQTAEVSKAPPPINPIKSTHSDPPNKVDKDGNFVGTQEEYEKARRAGKIGAAYH